MYNEDRIVVKKYIIYLSLGVLTEIAKTIISALQYEDSYEFTILRFIIDIIAFTLFYSTIPFTITTLREWRMKAAENGLVKKICVISQLISICMLIGIDVSYNIGVIIFCEIGILVISVGLLAVAVMSLKRIEGKTISSFAFKCAAVLWMAEYVMLGFGTYFA